MPATLRNRRHIHDPTYSVAAWMPTCVLIISALDVRSEVSDRCRKRERPASSIGDGAALPAVIGAAVHLAKAGSNALIEQKRFNRLVCRPSQ